MDTQKLPEGVELFYTDRAVHLTTNGPLMAYLRQMGNGSLPLSRAILDGYAAERGAQLKITERSMATELLIHAYLDGIFDRWVRSGETHGRQDGKLYKTAKRLKNATAVIDMGERSVDTNRWVFDLLAPGYGILCFLLGSRA
mgnify:FL=1